MKTESNIPDRVNSWMKHSVTLKLISITILILLLLIPSSMIKSIINEREFLSQEAIREVGSKWANAQLLKGPILTIPLLYEIEGKDETKEITRYLHILPDELAIDGVMKPEKLKRGIYEIVVYKSNIELKGTFTSDFKIDPNHLTDIKWDDAFLTIGISDLRGIKENIRVIWDGKGIKAQPGSRVSDLIYSGVTVPLPNISKLQEGSVDFSFQLNLQGSENLSFVPTGGTTHVGISSEWSSPSFNGNFLPNNRTVNEDGFEAGWKVLQLNRNFPQFWMGNQFAESLENASFGVDLLLPLDDYQKSMRSAKYAVMTIGLTFLIFFLVEILHRRKIHAFQYTLVGLSLCLFYVLLVSISEHSSFNFAYGISMLSVVSMITMYARSVFGQRKITVLLMSVLIGIYSFLFVTLQLADYALLMGSVGLLFILAATMYFTRNIDWYQIAKSKEGS